MLQGTHSELLAIGGLYSQLWTRQATHPDESVEQLADDLKAGAGGAGKADTGGGSALKADDIKAGNFAASGGSAHKADSTSAPGGSAAGSAAASTGKQDTAPNAGKQGKGQQSVDTAPTGAAAAVLKQEQTSSGSSSARHDTAAAGTAPQPTPSSEAAQTGAGLSKADGSAGLSQGSLPAAGDVQSSQLHQQGAAAATEAAGSSVADRHGSEDDDDTEVALLGDSAAGSSAGPPEEGASKKQRRRNKRK